MESVESRSVAKPRIKDFFSLVTFSHTVFAMPFGLLGFTLGAVKEGASLSWTLLGLVILCMVFARNTAMAFNRLVDSDVDKLNPRTAMRELPAGVLDNKSVILFIGVNALLFVLSTWFINEMCFYFSFAALAVIMGYSYTKRFTALCHFVLGVALALAPIGAYLAVQARFDFAPVLYGLSVLFWVAGFDIIYSLQDEEFDRNVRLYSIPAIFGRKKALKISRGLHIICALLLLSATAIVTKQYPSAGMLSWLSVVIFISFLIYQQRLVSPDDLSKVNRAFFTANGIASVLFGSLMIIDLVS